MLSIKEKITFFNVFFCFFLLKFVAVLLTTKPGEGLEALVYCPFKIKELFCGFPNDKLKFYL